MAQEMCRHPGCTCAARRDGFCSEACAGAGADQAGQPCPCGHDECQGPTKAEGWGAVAELAPEGRFVANPQPRDW
jgi:hypothetical protein